MKKLLLITLCVASGLFVGCEKKDVAEAEKRERADALFAEAMAAESRGDLSAAEALYEQLLQRDATQASAHLNLANLQHDLRKEYIGAIYHYRQYLLLQPGSEKTGLVKERLNAARTALAAQLAAERVAVESRALTAERDDLKRQVTDLEKALSETKWQLTGKEKELDDLRRQIVQLNNLVAAMKASEDEAAKAHAEALAKAKKAAEEAKAKVEEDPADLLIEAVRKDALRMIEEEDGGQRATNEATRAAVEDKSGEEPVAATPTAGKRYLVRPGDTLSKLSREAYGNAAGWTKIRNANRSSTNPDGRLRAGETVLIP